MADARAPLGNPSAFFRSVTRELTEAAPDGRLLDLACGRGRHSVAAADLGLQVLGVDRNAESLAALAEIPIEPPGTLRVQKIDLETGSTPTLDAGPFEVVLVFRYLHRPLCPWIETQLVPGGRLVYETFTRAQRELGWGPKSDDFLLESGELLELFRGLEIERFEEGPSQDDPPAQTARLLARRPL